MRNPILCPLLLFVLLAMGACSDTAQPTSAEQAQQSNATPPFDPGEFTASVRPQDDFWTYINGQWLAETEIPADRSAYGTFHQISDRTEEQVHDILKARADRAEADDALADLYQSFMNEEAIDGRGLASLVPLFQRIDALQNQADLPGLFGELIAAGVNTPVRFYNDNDAFDNARLILYLWQSGLGLPDRSYYLNDNEKLVASRAAYKTHIENMFALAGWPRGAEFAGEILKLETTLAQAHWTRLQNRDRQKIYSQQASLREAQIATPAFDIMALLEGMGAPRIDKLVLAQTSYFATLGEIVDGTPLATWQAYLKFRVLKSFSGYLSEPFVAEDFDFQGRTLQGRESLAPRWRRAVRFVTASAGELLGRAYVGEHFSEAAKKEVYAMVENLRKAFDRSIRELEWMSEPTRQEALSKLSGFLPKLGYPDTWRDYSGLETDPEALVENALSARRFNHDYAMYKLTQPADRGEWTTHAHMVNAFYRPTHNSITFPAGILQAPFFSLGRDPAMNYGAIGTVIGHEFSHGFDDQGRKFDGEGLLRNWWTDADAAEYQRRAEVIVAQYGEYFPLADTPIDGKLTLGENIGDLAGVIMAYRAFELSGHADGPALAGFTPRQRFFISYAMAWRAKIRDPYLRELLLRDTHSPAQYRVMGVLPNVPGFYQAFDLQPGDDMYLAPEARAKIW